MTERVQQRSERPQLTPAPQKRVAQLILAAAAVAGIALCILLAIPFLGALTWALALAIVFAPLHRRIEAAVAHPNLAALASVLLIVLVFAIPAAFVVERLVQEATVSASAVQAKIPAKDIQALLDAYPSIAPLGRWIDQFVNLPALMTSLAAWLSNLGASFARGSLVQLIEVLLTFYLLFYFLRDRRTVQLLLCEWLPLTHAETERLFRRVVDTVNATIFGTLAVAAVQGTLGGLMFWFLGLPAPLLWGVVMGLLAVVPVLGAFVVWIPAAVFLGLDGNWGKALILVVWGTVVVGGIDNVLQPVLVGNRLRLHTVPAFISMIGGLVLFGAYGVILGPVVVTVTILLLDIWSMRSRNGQVDPPNLPSV